MIQSANGRRKSKSIDVGAQQIGAIYAKALLGAAEASGQTATVLEELGTIVHEVLDKYPKFEEILASALIQHDEKLKLIDQVFGKRFSPVLVDFLKVVSSHGRLRALRAIHQQALKQYDEISGIVRVKLSTATAVKGGLTESVKQVLQSLFPGQLEIEQIVDPELIGGAVVRVGDTVYDGSVASQLEHVRQQMIIRSVHEIQSRRDRFRHTGGD